MSANPATPQPTRPSFAMLVRSPTLLLAFGFGTGLAKKAPGTVGTLVGIPFYLLLTPLSIEMYLAVVLLLFVVGIGLCDRASHFLGVPDHGGIVWDEIVGYLVTMTFAPCTWYWLLAGFVLFRFFDILKPWPISWLDREIHGGLGIMLDDLLAGIFAGLALWLIVWVSTPLNL